MDDVLIKRVGVIALYKAGHQPTKIIKLLKNIGVKKQFVYDTIKRYQDTGSTEDRPRTGRPRSAKTPKMIRKLKARIRRNPFRKQKKLALQLKTSRQSVRRALKVDLGLKALKRTKRHYLNQRLKKQRLVRSRALLKRYTDKDVDWILFTDEKTFTVEEHFNVQNDRIYAKSREEIPEPAKRVLRSHHPASVMVWAGVSSQGLTKLHFVNPGVKVRTKNYLKDILEPAAKPLNQSVFKGHRWTFQQDSAPAHKAKITQNWLQKEVPDFISYLEWPASSPDLNPLDYKIWSKLEEMACSRPH
jgi:inhibitor of nuclear factor kappa-B kinase subunit alpha